MTAAAQLQCMQTLLIAQIHLPGVGGSMVQQSIGDAIGSTWSAHNDGPSHRPHFCLNQVFNNSSSSVNKQDGNQHVLFPEMEACSELQTIARRLGVVELARWGEEHASTSFAYGLKDPGGVELRLQMSSDHHCVPKPGADGLIRKTRQLL